jgi:hypothetical protein
MNYHIDTGLIKEKFAVDCECPLCEIKKVVEEQFLHEFLNDAVMEDNTRIKVGKLGFCDKHFDMLFSRPNKLSVALQVRTRVDKLQTQFGEVKSVKQAQKYASEIKKASTTCIICDLVEESMTKYYKTIAQMYANEKDFLKTLIGTKGFCMHHYAELLQYSKSASVFAKNYVEVLSGVQNRNIQRLQEDLKKFCDKHDYRNANEPLGTAETALPRIRTKLYGKKYD